VASSCVDICLLMPEDKLIREFVHLPYLLLYSVIYDGSCNVLHGIFQKSAGHSGPVILAMGSNPTRGSVICSYFPMLCSSVI
jgi:hypothetical protein